MEDINLLEDILDDYLDESGYKIAHINGHSPTIYIRMDFLSDTSDIHHIYSEFKKNFNDQIHSPYRKHPQGYMCIQHSLVSLERKFLEDLESTDLFKRIYKLTSYRLNTNLRTIHPSIDSKNILINLPLRLEHEPQP